MKIYTRRGDLGKTDLIGGLRVEKNDMRICCCGTVDELNCYLGVTIASCEHEVLRDILLHLQHELFNLGADLAKPLDAKGKAKRIEQSQIDRMEQQIDQAFYYKANDINQHLYTWCPMTFGNLVNLAGFKVLSCQPFLHQWCPDFKENYNKPDFHKRCREYAKKITTYKLN